MLDFHRTLYQAYARPVKDQTNAVSPLSLFSLHLDFDHQNPLSTGYQLLDRTPTLGYARTASENDRIYAYRYNNE